MWSHVEIEFLILDLWSYWHFSVHTPEHENSPSHLNIQTPNLRQVHRTLPETSASHWRQKTHRQTLKCSRIWSPHSTLSLQIGSPRLAHPDHASSDLFFLCSFFLCSNPDRASLDCASSSVLRSTRSWFVLLQNRVLKTWFCFLELKSIRLEIYVASCCQLTKWESSLQSSSFKLKLSLSNLKC